MDATQSLEMALSRVLMRARVIERAVYAPETEWMMAVATDHGRLMLPATRWMTDDGVRFAAEVFWPAEGLVELWADDEMIMVGSHAEVETGDILELAVDIEAPAFA